MLHRWILLAILIQAAVVSSLRLRPKKGSRAEQPSPAQYVDVSTLTETAVSKFLSEIFTCQV